MLLPFVPEERNKHDRNNEMTEWIQHPTDNCGDCGNAKSIDLQSGQTPCDTPVCRAAADIGAIAKGNDFLGEHFEIVVIS